MTEIWHPVAGYESHYEVSNLGGVRSLAHYVPYRNGGLKLNPAKVLKPCVSNNGYFNVSFCVDGVKSNHSVHRLVARAFIRNESCKPQVNHIDGDKENNRLDNLEWVTVAENSFHAIHVLGKKPTGRRRNVTPARVQQLESKQ